MSHQQMFPLLTTSYHFCWYFYQNSKVINLVIVSLHHNQIIMIYKIEHVKQLFSLFYLTVLIIILTFHQFLKISPFLLAFAVLLFW